MKEKSRYQNDVMFSALSGLLFFWLMVQYSIGKDTNTRGLEEKNFVNSWCLIGNYLLIFLLCFFFNIIVYELSSLWIFSVFAEFFGFLILFLIIFSLPILIAWKHIQFHSVKITSEDKSSILRSFVPVFSSYQWYSTKLFDTPNFWLKEAQLWFLIIWLLLFFFNSWMIGLVFWGFLFLRVVFLLFWADVFSGEQKQRMRHRFLVYPEESFSVIFAFIRQWISLLFKKKEVSVEELLKYQESYRMPWNLKTYLLTWIFSLGIVAFIYYWRIIWLYWKIIPILWIIVRIWIFFSTKTKVPKMPVVAELTA